MDIKLYTLPNFTNDYHLTQELIESLYYKYPPAVFNIDIQIQDKIVKVVIYERS